MPQRPAPIARDRVLEVPLPRAPLDRVVAQIRFPDQLSVERREVADAFQGAIRDAYPVLRAEAIHVARGDAHQALQVSTAWRFFDRSEDWRVTLTTGFLALETRRYTSRADFVGRLFALSKALEAHVAPSLIDRLGIRYIDRVVAPELARLDQLVHADVLGVARTLAPPELVHALAETLLRDEDVLLLARSGYLPSHVTHDPEALAAIDKPSWILDIDAHISGAHEFSCDWIRAEADALANRVYRLFRWAVTDEFLRAYGGNL